MHLGDFWDFSKFHDLVRSTFLRGPKSKKTGVLQFGKLVTLYHKLSCVKSRLQKSMRVSTMIIFDVLSDGNNPVA